MIYTLTINPSIDYYMYHDSELREGINRSDRYEFIAAGKGVNVSAMLSALQMQSCCVVVCGGFTGEYIVKELRKKAWIHTIPVSNSQESRINVKIRCEQKEIDINTAGPKIDDHAKEVILRVFDQVRAEDIVCINGSLQSDMKETLLMISNIISDHKAKLILDVPNVTAEEIIAYRPYLIKPNLDELKQLMGMDDNLKQLLDKAKAVFIDRDINILLSMGDAGSCFLSKDRALHISSARVPHVVNTVAAGDSLLAGFLYMQAQQRSIIESLKFASAAGSASVMSSYLPTLTMINDLYEQVVIEEIMI